VVFLDTTSLYFEGEGGASLGARGHSKDYRPQLNQMIVGIIIDAQGRPVCSEMWPGNTADVTTLIPVIDRLRRRFAITEVCVVADRGMISGATIAALEQRGLDYILGVRERASKEVREVVLADPTPGVPLVIPHDGRANTELPAKTVTVGSRRYVVCRHLGEAAQAARTRAAVVAVLRAKLAQGDKALVGNSAYRRYLKTPDERHFSIDDERVAEDARYDGLYVVRTSTRLPPLEVMRRYRELLVVEQLFRSAKALLATRPIYHQTDAAIRGHVFCGFLALVLRKELEDRLSAAWLKPEWRDLLADLDRLQELTVVQDGKRLILRTPVSGVAGQLFQAVGVALPPNIRDAVSAPAVA
jgi:transposase